MTSTSDLQTVPADSDLRRDAFAGLVDSAAMFPPAEESLDVAAAGYRQALSSDPIGLYGRLLVPAGLLGRLAAHVDASWGIGVVLGPDATTDTVRDVVHTALSGTALRIESVELRACPELPEMLLSLTGLAAVRPISVFVEVPSADPGKALADLAQMQQPGLVVGAKLRCGGLRAEAFPTPAEVAGFLTDVRRLGLTMKATQGLHHPFRTPDELTGALQHGFVNLVAALALAHAHPLLDLEEVVAEADRSAFTLSPTSLRWRDLTASRVDVRRAREVLTGLGSCSLTEPLVDLRSFGMAS